MHFRSRFGWSQPQTNSRSKIHSADLALVFPPLTEARLFPYLSLPMLTAWLRLHGRAVIQRDLNIELCHQIFQRQHLSKRLNELTSRAPDLAVVHRVEMIRYISERIDSIRVNVFDKKINGNEASQHDIRFCRQGIELLLEPSLLSRKLTSFEAIAAAVDATPSAPEHDSGASVLENLLDELMKSVRPRILGVSIAFWSQLLPALLLARWARMRDPNIIIVFGGQHVMLWQEQLSEIASRWVDGLCIGAGESCLENLCRALDGEIDRTLVPNMRWLESCADTIHATDALSLDTLPPPDFSDLPIRGYLSEEVHLAMITCIGCYWGKCVFCSYGNRNPSGGGYQQASPEYIANTCEALMDQYGVERINFVDENTPVRNVLQGMRILNGRGRKIRFSTRNRLDPCLLDSSLCKELSQRGCVLMSVGYETNSQRLLDKLNKGVKAIHYEPIIENLHRAGIPLRMSVMGGILDETEEERLESERFLRKHAEKIGIDIMQMLIMEPGTDLWKYSERFGLHADKELRRGLRGNELLNFGMGRVGASFSWNDGAQFDERLNGFIEIFRTVNPQKNDELPPHRRHDRTPTSMQEGLVVLLPWVRLVALANSRDGEACLLIDLLWQRFYRLPGDWAIGSNGGLSSSSELSNKSLLRQVVVNGLAVVTFETQT